MSGPQNRSTGSAAAIELVLPSGRFATIRTDILARDLVVSYHDNVVMMTLLMAAQLTKIDGKELHLDNWLTMPAEDFVPIRQVVVDMLERMMKHNRGIA